MQLPGFLGRLLGSRGDTPYQLYGAVVAQSRLPSFYADMGVPDTLTGRFDMIVLHVFLVVDRLQKDSAGRRLAQDLVDVIFADFDRALREMGVGDLSVPKKIKTMAGAYNGRTQAYARAFAAGSEEMMGDAVARNLFPDDETAPAAAGWLARYAFEARAVLAGQTVDEIAAAGPRFPPARTGGGEP